MLQDSQEEDQNQKEEEGEEECKMKIEILERGEDWIKIKVSGIDYTLANSIRRSSYEVYIPAIDELEFYVNDSVLYDEILAHRLGLVPLLPNREINIREECDCEGKGCKKCMLKIKLEAKGKGMVYSKDIEGEAKALFNMPIVWLEEGQELKLVGYIKMGNAIEHAKYQAGLVMFNPVFRLLDFSKDFFEENKKAKEILEKFNIRLEKNTEINEKQYEILDWIKEKYPESKIKIEISETDFIFYIETYSYLKPEEIFVKSIEALDKNLAQLAKEIKK
jgi:DNA-directed RNA polymerase subunit D